MCVIVVCAVVSGGHRGIRGSGEWAGAHDGGVLGGGARGSRGRGAGAKEGKERETGVHVSQPPREPSPPHSHPTPHSPKLTRPPCRPRCRGRARTPRPPPPRPTTRGGSASCHRPRRRRPGRTRHRSRRSRRSRRPRRRGGRCSRGRHPGSRGRRRSRRRRRQSQSRRRRRRRRRGGGCRRRPGLRRACECGEVMVCECGWCFFFRQRPERALAPLARLPGAGGEWGRPDKECRTVAHWAPLASLPMPRVASERPPRAAVSERRRSLGVRGRAGCFLLHASLRPHSAVGAPLHPPPPSYSLGERAHAVVSLCGGGNWGEGRGVGQTKCSEGERRASSARARLPAGRSLPLHPCRP